MSPSKRKTSPVAPPPPPPSELPAIYGLQVKGNHLVDYPDGTVARIDQHAVYSRGDVVAVWFRPEVLKPGSAKVMIMRVVMMPSFGRVDFPYEDHPDSEVQSIVMLGRDDRPGKMLPVRCSTIAAIHKAVECMA